MDTSKLEESVGGLIDLTVDNKKVVNEILSFARKIDERTAACAGTLGEAEDKRLDEIIAGMKAILAQTAPTDHAERLLRSQAELVQVLSKPSRQDVYHHHGILKVWWVVIPSILIAGSFAGLYWNALTMKREAEANDIQWRYLKLVAPEIAGGIAIKYSSDPELFSKNVQKEEALRDEIARQRDRENESHKKAADLDSKRPIK